MKKTTTLDDILDAFEIKNTHQRAGTLETIAAIPEALLGEEPASLTQRMRLILSDMLATTQLGDLMPGSPDLSNLLLQQMLVYPPVEADENPLPPELNPKWWPYAVHACTKSMAEGQPLLAALYVARIVLLKHHFAEYDAL